MTTLALIPRRRPFHPSLATMILSASAIPRALRIRASLDVPRVCKRVCEQKEIGAQVSETAIYFPYEDQGRVQAKAPTLATSNGVVKAAATPPATPPAAIWVEGEYSPVGFKNDFKISYTENWTACRGMFIKRVVG